MSKQHCEVVVIGGGLQGLSSALHLARRGVKTVLLEAEYCGRHASGVNAGGVRSLGRHTAELPLALLAMTEYWPVMDTVVGHDCSYVGSGHLQLAETEEELFIAEERAHRIRELGYSHEKVLDAKQVRELVPSLASHVKGALWVAEDGYALPYHTVLAFKQQSASEGVQIYENTPVVAIEQHGDDWLVSSEQMVWRCGHVVNAAGAWASDLAAFVGEDIPAIAQGLMLMVTERVDPFVVPVLGALGRPLSFKQFSNGTVVVGGSLVCKADKSARCADVDVTALYNSARTVTDLFPHLENIKINRVWAGVEAFLPDSIPVISASSVARGLTHAFGFSAHGFQLSPAVGRVVSELVCGEQPSVDISAFSASRVFH